MEFQVKLQKEGISKQASNNEDTALHIYKFGSKEIGAMEVLKTKSQYKR